MQKQRGSREAAVAVNQYITLFAAVLSLLLVLYSISAKMLLLFHIPFFVPSSAALWSQVEAVAALCFWPQLAQHSSSKDFDLRQNVPKSNLATDCL